jgi:hypothetical protein
VHALSLIKGTQIGCEAGAAAAGAEAAMIRETVD